MEIRKKTTREISKVNRERTSPKAISELVLWLHNVRSMHNIGSAFRTADAFGIKQLLLSGYTPAPPRAEISKTALGADETVSWNHFVDPKEPLDWCRANRYILIGMEQTHTSKLLTEYRPDSAAPVCLLFGNELTGLDTSLLERCDVLLEIPQYGKKHSFNISVSIGITLYHFLSCSLP